MKKCPFCAEKIQDEAVVCRYCHKELPKKDKDVPAPDNIKKKKMVLVAGGVLGIILIAVTFFFLFLNKPDTNVYLENFNDPTTLTDWDVKTKDQNANVVAMDGGYRFSVENGSVGSILRRKNFSDSVLTIDLEFLTSESATVAIICRNLEGGYGFGISNDGQWTLDKSGKLLGSGETDSLNDGVNKVKVSCVGQQFTLEINNEIVGTAYDPEFSLGEIGLGLSSSGKAEVVFDNLKIIGAYTQVEAPAVNKEPTHNAESEATATITVTPTPQATSTPSPTPTIAATLRPTPIPADEVLLYQTDFEDNDASLANWTTFAYSYPQDTISTEGYEIFTNTSYYRFRASQTNQRIYSIYDVDLGTSDVDISLERPMYDNGNVGLVCRYSDAGWYQFMMEGVGNWSIRLVKYDESGKSQFYKLTSGSKPGAMNLRAECKGDRLTFYLDGTLVSSLLDDTFPQGKAGVLGWSFDQPGQIAFIDSFSIKRAEWRESDLTTPAPTPGADGTLYSTNFEGSDDLSRYWTFSQESVVILLSPLYIQETTTYINDYDPGVSDVEISADLVYSTQKGRTLMCRYSQDGWYSVLYEGSRDGIWLSLRRVARGSDGKFKETELNGITFPFSGPDRILTLNCSGSQISAAINGQTYVSAEDILWRSGRYGFSFVSNESDNPVDAFASYAVREGTPLPEEDVVVAEDDFEDVEASRSKWRIDPLNTDVQFMDGAAYLYNHGRINSPTFLAGNVEAKLDVEFMGDSIKEAAFSCSLGIFKFQGDGNWQLFGENEFIISSSTSPSPFIEPDKNEVTYRCMDGQFTFIANGETVITINDLSYDTSWGENVWVSPDHGSQLKIDNLALSVVGGSIPLQLQLFPGFPNQVVLPTIYEPGEIIYRQEGEDREFISKFTDQINWTPWIATDWPTFDPQLGVVIPDVEKPIAWFSTQDMSDQPTEMSAQVIFTDDKGGMGFICRNNPLGRYEFMIQPNGSWVIRRNSSYWWDPRVDSDINILAQGTSEAITTNENDITAMCSGPTLSLTVNGEQLATLEDDLYPEGEIGIWFEPYTPASFKDLIVKAPN